MSWITIIVLTALLLLSLFVVGFYTFLFAAATLAVLLRASLYKVLPNYYGEQRFFGWRAPASMLIKRGWGFWIPPFLGGSVCQFSLLNQKISGETEFVTADKTKEDSELGIQGREVVLKLPWYAEITIDPKVMDSHKRVRFLGLDPEVMQEGIAAYMHAKLSKLGGLLTSDEVVSRLREIEDYLRAFLQYETPPHKTKETSAISFDKLLDWYKNNKEEVEKLATSQSKVESAYGLKFRTFRVKFPRYTEETQKAIEAEHQALLRAEAATRVSQTAKEIKEALLIPGEEALGAAKLLHRVANVKEVIVSMRGGGGNSIPILNLGDLVQSGSKEKGGKS